MKLPRPLPLVLVLLCLSGAAAWRPAAAAAGSVAPGSAPETAPGDGKAGSPGGVFAGLLTLKSPAPPSIVVSPLPGWPKWVGRENHQISGLAWRDGRLYAISDQNGVLPRSILEIVLTGVDAIGGVRSAEAPRAAERRVLDVKPVCRWEGGPHPDAEGLTIDPFFGPPRAFIMNLESGADCVLEVGAADCALRGSYGPLTGQTSNEGTEGIALSPDGKTLYLVHETERTLLTLPRGAAGPARVVARIPGAASLCDIAYDDRGTAQTDDDRLLLLDRNDPQIILVTLTGQVTGIWRLDRDALGTDPEGAPYSIVSLEGLAIESRGADGSLIVYAATDTPPRPFPYHRRGKKDTDGMYERRVGMLYRFRLPPVENASAPTPGGPP